jgi:DNA-directed RNA polymerase specialized sigma24 family protein
MNDFAALLARAGNAEPRASEQLFASLYAELRRLAESQLRRQGGPAVASATTLVHEAYMTMIGQDGLSFPDRARFFAYASRAMRGLLVDYSLGGAPRSAEASSRSRCTRMTPCRRTLAAPS